jgi:hypothetical protein
VATQVTPSQLGAAPVGLAQRADEEVQDRLVGDDGHDGGDEKAMTQMISR